MSQWNSVSLLWNSSKNNQPQRHRDRTETLSVLTNPFTFREGEQKLLMNTRPISIQQTSVPDRKVLINGLTLIALGISIFALDTWGNLFVRLFVGLFWTSFLLFLNGPGLVRAMRTLKTNGRRRRINHSLGNYERRTSGY